MGGLTPTFPNRVGSISIGTGRGTGPLLWTSASFINFRLTRRLATWAGVVVGSRVDRATSLFQSQRPLTPGTVLAIVPSRPRNWRATP